MKKFTRNRRTSVDTSWQLHIVLIERICTCRMFLNLNNSSTWCNWMPCRHRTFLQPE